VKPAGKTAKRREAVVEPRGKAPDPEHIDLRRRQLDRQRHAIEVAAYFEHGGDIGIGKAHTAERRGRSFAEQLDRWKAQGFGRREAAPLRRNLERRQAQQPFALGPHRLPAGCQNGDLRHCLQHRLGSGRCGVGDVLAVVEDYQCPFIAQPGHKAAQRISDARSAAQGRTDRTRYKRRILQRCQTDKPNAVAIGAVQRLGGRNRDGCFSYGPTIVRKRCRTARAATVAMISARPITRVNCAGRLLQSPGRFGGAAVSCGCSRLTGATKL
jgi:hypothetical protein